MADQTNTLRIGILGLGYVGLPLAVEFAKKQVKTIGFDISKEKVDLINQGKSYIPDIQQETLEPLVLSKDLSATTDFSELKLCNVVIVCVPTPLNDNREPDVRYIELAARTIRDHLQKGQLIILESTTYPRTTTEIFVPTILNGDWVIGQDFHVAFSPERIDPGNAKYGVHNTPKVVGGFTNVCGLKAKEIYELVTNHVVQVSSPTAAEMVKLLENTFRSVNIALANEFALICEKLELNIWEIVSAASTKPFGFMPFYPGPGVGGHCIPIDPLYLSWKMRTMGYKTKFIDMADEINIAMPHHIVNLASRALNKDKKAINGSKILVLGVAYKKNIDDFRESPALEIIHELHELGAVVDYHDPYVPILSFSVRESHYHLESVKSLSAVQLMKYDVVVIVTDHSEYVDKTALLIAYSNRIVDTRNLLGNDNRNHPKIIQL